MATRSLLTVPLLITVAAAAVAWAVLGGSSLPWRAWWRRVVRRPRAV
ncbi:hypothetical protein [Curtobacterium sp. VKM Ac-1376]|nr:hypothetical protein [Curtobacterium sp. VKM Ac-1376]MBF4615013.1 hypothetical protein [Curtobacterium sp. VKM Ac-1376]